MQSDLMLHMAATGPVLFAKYRGRIDQIIALQAVPPHSFWHFDRLCETRLSIRTVRDLETILARLDDPSRPDLIPIRKCIFAAHGDRHLLGRARFHQCLGEAFELPYWPSYLGMRWMYEHLHDLLPVSVAFVGDFDRYSDVAFQSVRARVLRDGGLRELECGITEPKAEIEIDVSSESLVMSIADVDILSVQHPARF